jgi:microcystin-dependent protein
MDEYIGVIKMFAPWEHYFPDGYLPCDGRSMPIHENQALFALLGNNYGGDGQRTFGIPDLREKDKNGAPVAYERGKPTWIICVQGIFPAPK